MAKKKETKDTERFIEIPFGAFDSESMGWTYTIPEGFTAKIEDGKIMVEKEDENIRKEIIEFLTYGIWRESDIDKVKQSQKYAKWVSYLEKQKDASKAIEAVDRIDKYIDGHVANAHDMSDSIPDKKYYQGWDDALSKIEGILQDIYSEEKQKEQKPDFIVPESICPKFAVGDTVCRPMWSDHTIREIYINCNDPVYVCVNDEGLESHIPFSEQDEWEKKEQKTKILIPKFQEGDMVISTKNNHLTYKILEVGHINELGNPDYKVEIFADGKHDEPRNIKYIEIEKMDSWGELIEQKPAERSEREERLMKALRITNARMAELIEQNYNLKEQKPAEWSAEDDAIHTRVLGALGKAFMKVLPTKPSQEDIEWFKSLPERFNLQPKQEWSEEDESMLARAIDTILIVLEQCDNDKERNIYQEEIEWLASLCPQQKVEWTGEDERMRQTAIEACKTVAKDYENSNARFYKCKDWLEYRLKSLRPQPHWKPSKEQIDALNSIILNGSFTYVGQAQDLISLKDDLKKL